MKFYKYHGAGNDFLIADGRGQSLTIDTKTISALCNRHTGFGADGLMILEDAEDCDFKMRYYNSDGSGGMMCGNGGRCIVAFAADLGFTSFRFEAPDGMHEAFVEKTIEELVEGQIEGPSEGPIENQKERPMENPVECQIDGDCGLFSTAPKTVRLKMINVEGAQPYPHESGCDWFLDTGTRHLVRFKDNLQDTDVVTEGRKLRHDSKFAPVGVNVNFVKRMAAGQIGVRTYEKGVEDETLACGTGIVASAMASWIASVADSGSALPSSWVSHTCAVRASIADLSVSFKASFASEDIASFRAEDVWLTGPATFVGIILCEVNTSISKLAIPPKLQQ